MTDWTKCMVEVQLRMAADVQRNLSRVPGVAIEGVLAPRPLPSPDAIERMEQAMSWLGWLGPEDAEIVWSREDGARWKMICWRFGISRATAHRRWRHALRLIACRLNGAMIQDSTVAENAPRQAANGRRQSLI